MTRAIFFDLDETLVAQERAFDRAYRHVAQLASNDSKVDSETLARDIPEVAREVFRRAPFAEAVRRCRFGGRDILWADALGDSECEREIAQAETWYRREVWSAVLQRHGIVDDELADRLGADFQQAMVEALELYDEVEEVLSMTSERYRCAIVTNGMESAQRRKIERLGIASCFDSIVASTAVGEGKPSPKVFAKALERMHVDPAAALMVGDSLEGDVVGARSVGMMAIWVNRQGVAGAEVSGCADREIRSLRSLPEALADLGC